MERRSALALLIALLILPFVRFLEEWSRPAFREVIKGGIRWYRASEVRLFLNGQEIRLNGASFAITES